VDLISLTAELPKDLLLAAQKNDKSTSRLVNALETSLEFASTLNSRWVNSINLIYDLCIYKYT
jgi:hypothetical protein